MKAKYGAAAVPKGRTFETLAKIIFKLNGPNKIKDKRIWNNARRDSIFILSGEFFKEKLSYDISC